MFGSILGTLQRFRADESKDKDRDLKKRKIEAKIDQKSEKEKEEAIRQKKELFEDKKKKEREIKVLQVNLSALAIFTSNIKSVPVLFHTIERPVVTYANNISVGSNETSRGVRNLGKKQAERAKVHSNQKLFQENIFPTKTT